MKIFLLSIFVICSFTIYSQNDCSKYIQTPTNTNGQNVSEIKTLIDISSNTKYKALSFYMLKFNEGSKIFNLSAETLGEGFCISERDSIGFVFLDNSQIKLCNEKKMNCSGKIEFKFGWNYGKIDKLNLLKSQGLKSIIIYTTDEKIKFDLPTSKSNYFLNAIKCLNK